MTDADLISENEILRERIRQLESALCPDSVRVPVEWLLTSSEAKVFAHLASRDFCTRESILLSMYSDRVDEAPEPKIVDVFICKLRRKVKPFGVAIDTIWGRGWSLQDRNRFCGEVAA
ncbi:helix-turn-helix domain-containing protein [Rhizobium sp. ARZ01]|uniref:helix-turn-helix domain-containing protein n=1 Tax=Rhizobium sp. ARZ01 TaxID=2769313 RepID=UPI00177F8F94|nr:helix-turn-helix domain-containing protein [Rhizobium sp. ARZ01]MBD9372094.1 helix-turn-helix domain-containing protein [Rhizobium sp. ARZ01]